MLNALGVSVASWMLLIDQQDRMQQRCSRVQHRR